MISARELVFDWAGMWEEIVLPDSAGCDQLRLRHRLIGFGGGYYATVIGPLHLSPLLLPDDNEQPCFQLWLWQYAIHDLTPTHIMRLGQMIEREEEAWRLMGEELCR